MCGVVTARVMGGNGDHWARVVPVTGNRSLAPDATRSSGRALLPGLAGAEQLGGVVASRLRAGVAAQHPGDFVRPGASASTVPTAVSVVSPTTTLVTVT